MNHQKGGFTLIEILVVVTIIGILASITLLGLGPARRAGQDARRIADIRNVQGVLEIYFAKVGLYPPQGASTITEAETSYGNITTNLMSAGIISRPLPNDPNPSKKYGYQSPGDIYWLGAVLDGGSPPGYSPPAVTPGLTGMIDYCAQANSYCVTFR